MSNRDVVAWNSMMSGYGSHGECHKAIDLFHEMRNSGTAPDEITFLSLISSCNHCGFIDEEAGLKEKAANLRTMMRQKGLTKLPGCSWIEVKNKVDVFFSGDSSSPRTVKIYETLDSLGIA
ncbi:UNVERIFIED_CONTAM: Pentatricopeptide repeat-containing protein [Sesamum radiatum]|uniref:Pentatricopeptide repeat-containing protein n=1 Tax=Sesamum radiatum TaxID=300843 RepID=A0AAW2IIX0_SESRA